MLASDDEGNSSSSSSSAGSLSELDTQTRTAGASWVKYARKLGLDDSNDAGITSSAFDAYFNQIHRASRTSSNVFSQLVPSLSSEEFSARISSIQRNPEAAAKLVELEESHVAYFPAYISELLAGFSLMFYGYGSKRNLLNKMAKACAKKGHVAVANAFFPEFTLKDFLASVEQMLDVPDLTNLNAGQGHEAQCRRILTHFDRRPNAKRLFLVIHNIDSSSMRSSRVKNCLASLASHPSIHLIASVDHINAPLIWSATESNSSSSGFSWLWHDLTTMQPYDFELAYADRTTYAGASAANRQRRGGQADGVATQGGMVSESAAQHVLASVTSKAKKIFALLCQKQLECMEAAAGETGAHVVSSPQVASSYELIFTAARDEFIATNETALRALLAEFRDHSLVISSSNPDGGESLWVPLAKDVLSRIVQNITAS